MFSKRLKMTLKEQGLTQKDLAIKIQTSESNISRYISGKRTPNAKFLKKIANTLNVSIDYLLSDEEKER